MDRAAQAALGPQRVEAGRQRSLINDIAGHPAYFTAIVLLQGVDPLFAVMRAAWREQGDARRTLIGQPMAAQATQAAECAGHDVPAGVLEALRRQAGALMKLHAQRLHLRDAVTYGNPALTALRRLQARQQRLPFSAAVAITAIQVNDGQCALRLFGAGNPQQAPQCALLGIYRVIGSQ